MHHTASSAPVGVPIWLTILVALISAVPGIVTAIYAYRKRHDLRNATATEFGTKLAETAFQNMEAQVRRLTDEQERWDAERKAWEQDKSALLDKISTLSDELHLNNKYLKDLLQTLDANNIQRPVPPPGWRPPDF